MKRICAGILAHVDAGKTTLSEALLYHGGAVRKLGRVDHRDAFLDTDVLERERGITIFSKQARLTAGDTEIQLLDTPGHVDFSAEMERTLQVLDYAVLVVSGTDGVQGHTRTVWRLLKRYGVPVFIFVNKMDVIGTDRKRLMEELRRYLDEGCVAFYPREEEFEEQVALRDEGLLEEYLEDGTVDETAIPGLIARRQLFPVWFGSALKLSGVEDFLRALDSLTLQPEYPEEFGARVYQIGRDAQGARLTYLKVTGGELRVKSQPGGSCGQEKIDQIRLYSGEKFRPVDAAPAGTVCAVTGLSNTAPGQGLGSAGEGVPALLEPVLTYQVVLPEGCDPHTALTKLRMLEEEDPQLHILWNAQLRQIHMQLMGAVQTEILQKRIAQRFGLEVTFGEGSIVYRETISAPVTGVGHFEPLRHYAEVHLLLEPGERGSGLRFASACPEDDLDRNWQRLILTHLMEREHPGVLTGSPITDMKITLLAGRAHVKHTEGGDFRQATYRAVRQGLMCAQSVLLEPWYRFRLELPVENVGRAMTDLQQMHGEVASPETGEEGESILTGYAPVSGLRDYGQEVTAYTRGRGRLSCSPAGYRPCHDQEAAVEASGYDPERDVENPADSVFCSHGAGYNVKWNEVPAMAHLSPGLRMSGEREEEAPRQAPVQRSRQNAGTIESDSELRAIFERTYGPIKQRAIQPQREIRRQGGSGSTEKRTIRQQKTGPEYLLVDGYNVVFAWEELKAVAQENLDAARKLLCDLLSNYQGFRKNRVIVVFDAYKVPGGIGEVSKYHNIHVVYTKESQTADAYIEKATYELAKDNQVRVVTSDNTEQLIILGHGALRVSASAFREELEGVEGQISAIVGKNNRVSAGNRPVREAMERAEKKR